MKTHAQAVIIGGGVAGCSIAYHLTLLGWRDVVLVEKGELTSGSTFHSAGLVGQLRGSINLTKMMMNSVELYRTLEEEVDLDPPVRVRQTGNDPTGRERTSRPGRDRRDDVVDRRRHRERVAQPLP